jgi:dihydrolipoamide dehydrogenase
MLRRTVRFYCSTGAQHYDVCVIGGGPSGIAAALRAEQYGKRVCLVEKYKVGGADLWDGALQSKTMWEMAKFYDRIKTFGPCLYKEHCLDGLEVNEHMMHESLNRASQTRQAQILEALSESGVSLLKGTAEFQSPNLIHVHTQEPGRAPQPINADYFIIASGSTPRVHPQYAANGTTIQTSDHIMRTPIPKSMVIIGAGVIGCEFASIAANFGKTKVSIIEKAERMLPNEDEDVASYVEGLLAKKGVVFHHNASLHKLESFEEVDTPFVRYTIKSAKSGELQSFDVERALISIGRVPNYSGLGIEKAGCSVRNGRLEVDQFGRCVPCNHIYAVGDATVDIALVNMGENEAMAAVDHIYRPRREIPPDTQNLSTIMFLDQEVASVGLSEKYCKENNIAYIAARYGYDFVTRAVCMGAAEGFVKIIVTNDREKTVLGVRAVGAHASSIVELASLAIHNQQSVYDMGELLPAYPAMTQGFQECLRVLVNRSILKPNVFPQVRLWRWSPGGFDRGRAYANQSRSRR